MTDQEPQGAEHSPKHLLETGLLGRPKQGQERVSDLAARHDDPAHDQLPNESSDNFEEQEYVT